MLPNATHVADVTVPFADVAAGQLGLAEAALQPQPVGTVGNTSTTTHAAEGAPSTAWPRALALAYASRYMTAVFCSWYSTGGVIPGVLEQLPLADLNATGTFKPGTTGVMFEKFNATDPDAAGGGGEYTVQVG